MAGGSDLSSFYRQHGGAVVSTGIDKYMYITVNRKFDSGIRASYSQTEEVDAAHEIKHPLVRAGLNYNRFQQDDSVSVDPIICNSETLLRLQEHSLVFHAGRSRGAGENLAEQSKKTATEKGMQDTLIKMVALAEDLKRELDEWYETGRQAGAMGGKLLGLDGADS